jgi:hypothetical protein
VRKLLLLHQECLHISGELNAPKRKDEALQHRLSIANSIRFVCLCLGLQP